MNAPIRVAAAVIRDRCGRLLLVRKRGTRAFMQPGGKIARHEDALAALAREVHEELGCRIKPGTARFLGQFAAPAANEAGACVLADLYAVELEGDVMPAAEIEEAAWVDAAAPDAYRLAPLNTRLRPAPSALRLIAAASPERMAHAPVRPGLRGGRPHPC